MVRFVKQGRFLALMFMLVGCLAIQASDDLITKQIIIKLDKAGTLSDKIGSTKKYKITNLKIAGEINGKDWKFIRDMAGGNYCISGGGSYGISEYTSGKLSKLDLSEVIIVADPENGYAKSIGRGGGISYYYVKDKEIIPTCMFVNCRSLQELIIPSYITSIGASAFKRSGLQSIVLNDGIVDIGTCGFEDSNIASINIPESLKTIGLDAFAGCNQLVAVYTKKVTDWLGLDIRYWEYSYRQWNFHSASNPLSLAHHLYINDKEVVQLEIPEGIVEIPDGAFYGGSAITKVLFPLSVQKVGFAAFEDCNSVSSVSIKDLAAWLGVVCDPGKEETGESANPMLVTGWNLFLDGKALTNVKIPSNITSIKNNAFRGCCNLTGVEIPSSVTSIGNSAFSNCNNLEAIYVCWKTPLKIGADVFEKVDKQKCTLYVPKGTFQDYWLADVWGDFENIVEYDVTGIDKITNTADAKEVSRYSVNGQRLSVPTKGLNIVKYSDGSVKKVAVQ